MQKEKVIRERKLVVTKVRIQRPVTLTDPATWDADAGVSPPEFAIGDVVEVTVMTAQSLVGGGIAAYVDEADANPPDLVLRSQDVIDDAPATASVEAPENAVEKTAPARKTAKE